MLEQLKYLAPVGSSHHSLLKFDLCCYSKTDRPRVNKYKYDRGNYESMRDTMATRNWEHEFHNKSTEQRWGILEKTIKKTCDKHIPMRKAGRQTGLNMIPMWTNGRTMEAVKKKTEAYRLYREYRDEQHFIEYRRASNKVKTEVRNAVREFEKQIAGEAKRNPKSFYRYERSKMKTKSTVGDLERLDGTMADTDVQKAEVLNSSFASVFTTEGEGDIPQFERRTYNTELVDLPITKEDIERILKTLDTSKSPGPDGLHPRPLAEMAAQLAEPFQALFSTSLEEGILPQGWKDGNVTPIFKKGKKHQPGNYRPVSLTSIPCRVMEKLVRNEIMEHLINNNLLSKFQHGFIKARSCTTQLLAVLDDWTDVIEHRENVDAIYLDYAKAFDTVPHKRLLAKLYGYGIGGKLLKWIAAFLEGRRQRVIVNGSKSSWTRVTSGIPQGSVLGPLLFVCYVNDMPENITSTVYMFADDTKLYRNIKTHIDREVLQSDLSRLEDWSRKWQLRFNADKCKVLHIGRDNEHYEYYMDRDTKIGVTTNERDLGVQIDPDLKFNQHVDTVTSKANRMLGMIRRAYTYKDGDTIKRIYTSLIRPILEYGNAA